MFFLTFFYFDNKKKKKKKKDTLPRYLGRFDYLLRLILLYDCNKLIITYVSIIKILEHTIKNKNIESRNQILFLILLRPHSH